MKYFAVVGIAAIAQVLWLFAMMSAADANNDISTGGAYCAVWILGVPVVFVVSVIVGAIFCGVRNERWH